MLQGEGCSGELCREGWLEQVCGFPSSGMKEVREGEPQVGALLAEGCPQACPLGGGLWRSLCRFRLEEGSWWCEQGASVESKVSCMLLPVRWVAPQGWRQWLCG